MSRNEKIKEQIGWLKVIFGILSAIDISLAGWLATHYTSAEQTVLILTTLLIVIFSFGIVFVNKKAFDKIDELEEL